MQILNQEILVDPQVKSTKKSKNNQSMLIGGIIPAQETKSFDKELVKGLNDKLNSADIDKDDTQLGNKNNAKNERLTQDTNKNTDTQLTGNDKNVKSNKVQTTLAKNDNVNNKEVAKPNNNKVLNDISIENGKAKSKNTLNFVGKDIEKELSKLNQNANQKSVAEKVVENILNTKNAKDASAKTILKENKVSVKVDEIKVDPKFANQSKNNSENAQKGSEKSEQPILSNTTTNKNTSANNRQSTQIASSSNKDIKSKSEKVATTEKVTVKNVQELILGSKNSKDQAKVFVNTDKVKIDPKFANQVKNNSKNAQKGLEKSEQPILRNITTANNVSVKNNESTQFASSSNKIIKSQSEKGATTEKVTVKNVQELILGSKQAKEKIAGAVKPNSTKISKEIGKVAAKTVDNTIKVAIDNTITPEKLNTQNPINEPKEKQSLPNTNANISKHLNIEVKHNDQIVYQTITVEKEKIGKTAIELGNSKTKIKINNKQNTDAPTQSSEDKPILNKKENSIDFANRELNQIAAVKEKSVNKPNTQTAQLNKNLNHIKQSDSVTQKQTEQPILNNGYKPINQIVQKAKTNKNTKKLLDQLNFGRSFNNYMNTNPITKIGQVGLVSRISEVIIQHPATPNNAQAIYKVDGGEMGEIEIKMFQEQAATKATIVVETESAKSSLEKLLSTVKDNLNEVGVKVKSFNVEVNSNGENMSSQSKKFQRKFNMRMGYGDDIEINPTIPRARNFGYNTLEVVA